MQLRYRKPTAGHRQRGFTLIELMIAIAIVAILVALAVPAYQDYAIRSKVAECINNAAVAKVNVSEYRQSLGAWPPTASQAGIDGESGNTEFCDGFVSYTAATGAFTLDVDEAAIDSGITGDIAPTLTPTFLASGFINWDCSIGGTASNNYKYLPAPCRNT